MVSPGSRSLMGMKSFRSPTTRAMTPPLSGGVYIQATPTIGLALDGSYASVDQSDDSNMGDVERWAIDGSVQWAPVSGFVLAADVGYSSTEFDNNPFTTDIDNDGETIDALLFGVRLQRTF